MTAAAHLLIDDAADSFRATRLRLHRIQQRLRRFDDLFILVRASRFRLFLQQLLPRLSVRLLLQLFQRIGKVTLRAELAQQQVFELPVARLSPYLTSDCPMRPLWRE